MAISFTGALIDGLTRSGSYLSLASDFTLLLWDNLPVIAAFNNTIYLFGDGAYVNPYVWIGSGAAGLTIEVYDGVTTVDSTPSAVSFSAYHWLALTYSATTGVFTLYADGVAIGTVTLNLLATIFVEKDEYIFVDGSGAVTLAQIMANVRTWSSVLTIAQLQQESRSDRAIITSTLLSDTPLLSPSSLTDVSGHGRTWGLVAGVPVYALGPLGILLKTSDSALDDDGLYQQGYWKSRAIPPAGQIGELSGITQRQQPLLAAKSSSLATLALTIDRDFGADTQSSTLVLTPDGSELGVLPKFEGAAMADITVVQVQVGDSEAQAKAWSLDQLLLPVTVDGDR